MASATSNAPVKSPEKQGKVSKRVCKNIIKQRLACMVVLC